MRTYTIPVVHLWVTCLADYRIPDALEIFARKDGGLDKRYSVQNRPFVAWLAEIERKESGL